PEFADLAEAAAVGDYAHLFEAKTVLGRGPSEIVASAWDFERINALQRRYCRVFGQNLERLGSGKADRADAIRLAREEREAYLYAMDLDPLLPEVLWPPGYMGRPVWDLHLRLVKQLRWHFRFGGAAER
ncbi:MAG: hypothetical protein JXB04_12835, partial [Kiritimatiellae bacterium]|nr:hypothetical protein [Kiritimatiellia bacterium]